jgi:hypothetical protein
MWFSSSSTVVAFDGNPATMALTHIEKLLAPAATEVPTRYDVSGLIRTVDSVDLNQEMSTLETLEGRGFRCFCENEQEKGGEAIMKWIATNVLRAAFVLIVMCGMFPLANAQEVSRDCGGGDCGGGSTIPDNLTFSPGFHPGVCPGKEPIISGPDAVVSNSGTQYTAIGGMGKKTWSVTGTGASISDSGYLTLSAAACGGFLVTVTDTCGQSATLRGRISDRGQWIPYSHHYRFEAPNCVSSYTTCFVHKHAADVVEYSYWGGLWDKDTEGPCGWSAPTLITSSADAMSECGFCVGNCLCCYAHGEFWGC